MKRINDKGAVSILSVVIFTLLVTIVAVSFMRNIVIQQKESINYDFSTRAYYAAESGIQDAIRGVRADTSILTNPQTTCKNGASYLGGNGTVGANTSYGLSYTCQIVDGEPQEIEGTLDPTSTGVTVRIDPPVPGPAPYSIIIRWYNKSIDPTNPRWPRMNESKSLPPAESWYQDPSTETRPIFPMIRTSIISHPNTGALFSRNDIKQFVNILNPTTVQETPLLTADKNAVRPIADLRRFITNAKCHPQNSALAYADGYKCEYTINLDNTYSFSNDAIYMHLTSIYGPTDYQVSLKNGNSQTVGLRNSILNIDVTGKAGNVFRRVRQSFPLEYIQTNGIDAGLVAGDGICKMFSISTNQNEYLPNSDICDPSRPPKPSNN